MRQAGSSVSVCALTREIAQSLQALLSGVQVTSLRDGRHAVGVVVRASESERAELGDIGDLVLNVRDGRAVPVSQVARIEYVFEEPILWRRNRETVLTVRSDIVPGVQAPDVTAALPCRELTALSRLSVPTPQAFGKAETFLVFIFLT